MRHLYSIIYSLGVLAAGAVAGSLTLSAATDTKDDVKARSAAFHSRVKARSDSARANVAELRARANKKVADQLRRMWGDYLPEPPVQVTVIDPIIPEPDFLPYPEPEDREQEAEIVDPVEPQPVRIPVPLVPDDMTLPLPLLDTPLATDPYVKVPEAVTPVIDRRQALGNDPVADSRRVTVPALDTPLAVDPAVEVPEAVTPVIDRRQALGNDPVADGRRVTVPALDTPIADQPVVTAPVLIEPVIDRRQVLGNDPVADLRTRPDARLDSPRATDPAVDGPAAVLPSLPSFNLDIFAEKLTLPVVSKFALGPVSGVADAWDLLSADERYDLLVRTLYHLTVENNIAGWAALSLTDEVASRLTDDDASQAFLMTWLMVQLGYDMRLIEATDGRLLSAFGCDDVILSGATRNFFLLPVDGKRYYSWQDTGDSFPPFRSHGSLGEQLRPVSLALSAIPSSTVGETVSTRSSTRLNESIEAKTAPQGMLDFYTTFPRFCPQGGAVVTQWYNYANAPASRALVTTLEEPLRSKVSGMEPLEAVNTILTFVQDAFPYGYDDRIWGYDRPFFPDESVYYPKSDCEDHAILFTRLVRDILGLNCALVYYPNHLAAAVEIPGHVKGDYINVGGRRFTICDPTYTRPAGYTMPGMDNSTAQAGLLP